MALIRPNSVEKSFPDMGTADSMVIFGNEHGNWGLGAGLWYDHVQEADGCTHHGVSGLD